MLATIIAAGYWYWTGPYQEKTNPSYAAGLKKNQENMALCLRGAAYKMGATGTGSGTGSGDPEQDCAGTYNLYKHEGRWHSYDQKRPGQQ